MRIDMPALLETDLPTPACFLRRAGEQPFTTLVVCLAKIPTRKRAYRMLAWAGLMNQPVLRRELNKALAPGNLQAEPEGEMEWTVG